MSDESTSADLRVAVPSDEDQPLTVAQQLDAIRTAAMADLERRRADYVQAQHALDYFKTELKRSASVALDTGVNLETVSAVVGVSGSTITHWTKSLEGE